SLPAALPTSPVNRAPRVLIIDALQRVRKRNQLIPHVRLKGGRGVIQPAPPVAAHADLVARGLLRLETRVEPARGAGTVGELRRGRGFERGADVAVQGGRIGGGDA